MLSVERIRYELQTWDTTRLNKLRNYYDGNHDILNRTMDEGKPNNKLVHNYPSYIVDMFQGYLLGNPVTYSSTDEKLMETLQDIFNYNDEQDENSELTRQAGTYGRGQEIIYLDEDTNIRFNEVDPLAMKIIYNQDITPKIIGAIRVYSILSDDGMTETEYVECYDEREVVTYELTNMNEVDRFEHFFGDVPVVDYLNNSSVKGDFEDVLSLVDAYNLSRSNKTNDLEYFTDAYLYLVNMSGTTTDDVVEMKNNRVLLLDESGDAGFLVKPSNVEDSVQQVKNLNNDIHKFTKAIDLSDENFQTSDSGVAMGYKLAAMRNIAANKERKFKKGLQRRIELICNYLNFRGANFNYLDVSMKFEYNEPINETARIDGALKLNGFTSKETALSYLPSSIVSDITAEMKAIQSETDSYADTTFDEPQTVTTEVTTNANDGTKV
ncbi:MAG: phage portal protein [Candidatus Riflebacteria bacterium]|nr:phage portal protein [Candidatus Riflebacteria bacterium]